MSWHWDIRLSSRTGRLWGLRLVAGMMRLGPVSPGRGGPAEGGRPRRLLIIRPDHLGDLLFTAPTLAVLRQALPGTPITTLVGPWGQEVMAHLPGRDQILLADFPWFNRRPKSSPLAPYLTLYQTAARLRPLAFDTALILRFDHWWGAWLAAAAGIPRRIGYDLPECRPFLTEAIPYVPNRHEVLQNLTLALPLTGNDAPHPPLPSHQPASLPLRFVLSDAEQAAAAAFLAQAGIAAPFGVIHVGAGAAVKLWPVARWAEVARRLYDDYQLALIASGGSPAEETMIRELQAQAGRPVTPATGLSLGTLAALYARAKLVIGADSGPLHLAVAVGTPTVHLCGPVDPARFGPWGEARAHPVVSVHYFDSPCQGKPCNRLDYRPSDLPHHACMTTIPVEAVLVAIQQVMSNS